MVRTLTIACLSFTWACSAQLATRSADAPALGRAETPEAAGPKAARPEPTVFVELKPEPKEGRLRALVVLRAAEREGWSIADGRSVQISDVTGRDRAGALVITQRMGENGSVIFTADREPAPPVELRYIVTGKPDASSGADVCRFVVEPDRASFCGEQVLALASRVEAEPTRIRLVADGTFLADAASSFGLRDDLETVASPAELRSGMFVFGNLTTAEMRVPEGRDHAAALGYVSFDPRWVAAETAGFRTSVDRWLGIARPENDPAAGLVILAGAHPERPISIRRRARGLALSADVSAGFTAGARLRIAQLFAQRTIGGALWMGARTGEDETRGLWFSEGVSRAVALITLHELGAIDDDELAADINGFLAEMAVSGSDALTLDELASRARSHDAGIRDGAIRALTARGTLAAIDLGAADLRKVLKTVVQDASATRSGELSRDAFFATVRTVAGDTKAARLERSIDRGKVALDRTALGPCYELRDRSVAPFELGFTLVGAGRDLGIQKVVSGSAAARAGARDGDEVVSIDYRPDRSDVAVAMTILRDGKEKKVVFMPAGPSKPGRAFLPAKNAPRTCERS
ncbi:MAG: hypothetical protein HOV80_33805 [Polyangiaceae bacterium]|nr:hypothetical protein [Polyangiaceae bacterium]